MLIITFRNISGLAPVSDYKVNVLLNERRIAGPFMVFGHKRSDGWQRLVKRFTATARFKPKARKSRVDDAVEDFADDVVQSWLRGGG